MKNVPHNKNWNTGTVHVHVDPPPIIPIKIKNNKKSDKYFVKIKLRRDPTSEKSDLYELKIPLFDNGELEDFLLFVCNFNVTLEASGTLKAGVKVQYLHTLVRGEALR